MTFWEFADRHWFLDLAAIWAFVAAVAAVANALRRRPPAPTEIADAVVKDVIRGGR